MGVFLTRHFLLVPYAAGRGRIHHLHGNEHGGQESLLRHEHGKVDVHGRPVRERNERKKKKSLSGLSSTRYYYESIYLFHVHFLVCR